MTYYAKQTFTGAVGADAKGEGAQEKTFWEGKPISDADAREMNLAGKPDLASTTKPKETPVETGNA